MQVARSPSECSCVEENVKEAEALSHEATNKVEGSQTVKKVQKVSKTFMDLMYSQGYVIISTCIYM